MIAITLFSHSVSILKPISNIGISKSWSKRVNVRLTDLACVLSLH